MCAALFVLAPNWKQLEGPSLSGPSLDFPSLNCLRGIQHLLQPPLPSLTPPAPVASPVPGMQIPGSEHPWTWGGSVISSRTMSKADSGGSPGKMRPGGQSHHLPLTGGGRVGGGRVKMPITRSVRPSATCPECWPFTVYVEPSAGAPFPPSSLRGAICCVSLAPRRAAGIISAFLSNPTPAIHSSQFSPHLLLGDPTPNLLQFSL